MEGKTTESRNGPESKLTIELPSNICVILSAKREESRS